ncbi:hypothetical protein MTR_5g046210 [Medicago truncatula]|uniref:Uncharacterized protein n=1 Tax=Medicago truncatula TaxID=3880 RepID=G7JWX8_MEDTR|nr:hypothetical protein MTR_5g046210 [Medicago truncatula]
MNQMNTATRRKINNVAQDDEQHAGRKGCSLFNWYDEEIYGRAKEVILSLMKRID